MRDDERIEMYYKFGLLDWRNEQRQLRQETYPNTLNLSFANFNQSVTEFIKHLKALKVK